MLISLVIIFSSILSFIFCIPIWDNITLGYEYLWVIPLSFLFTYIFVYRMNLKRKSMRITTYIVIALSWIRCVITPLIGAMSGFYSSFGVLATIESTQIASVMIAYEQIFIGALLFIFSRKKQVYISNKLDNSVKLDGNKNIYIIYLLFTLAVFVAIGRSLNLFEFLAISTEETIRRGDITNTSTIIIRQIISSGMIFLFLLIVEKSQKAFNNTKNNIYINYALMAALLLVSIIIGERRSSQIYIAFATSWVLIRVFPFKQKKITLTITFAVTFVIILMSIYKFFNAYLYGSYISALSESNINSTWFAQTLDAYFFGVKVVSSNLAFSNISQINIINMLYDFARSTFGLSFIMKGDLVTTSELYNLTIYNGGQRTGYLFSSVGYGSVYLGYLFAPIVTWFNVYIALKLESWMRRFKSIEMNFIISYIFMRFAFGIFSNPAPLISSGSMYFILNGLIFVSAILFVNRRRTQKKDVNNYYRQKSEEPAA